MFNYARKDKTNQKPVGGTIPTPIEMQVNMPSGMQPIPPPITEVQPTTKCIYPSAPTKPSTPVVKPEPILPVPPVEPKPVAPAPPVEPEPVAPAPPVKPKPIVPIEPMQPCMQCPVCGNMGAHPNMPCHICGNVGKHSNMPCQMWNDMNQQMPVTDMAKCYNDMEIVYLKKMYPPVCQKIQTYIENELNQYDHELSPIYEMYPATETINHMANCVYNNMKGDLPNVIKTYECNRDTRAPMGGSFYTLVYALLLNELYRKRMSRHFSPTYSHFYDYY